MQKILDLISEEIKKAFEAAGYDSELGRATLSNRPDLCEFQCNGAMAGAKKYHKAPLMIAQDVAEKLQESEALSEVSAVPPGFLNMKVKESFVRDYLRDMFGAEKFGFQTPESKKIIIDYGGPNVAKPLHVGHLRSGIIGESIKRICRYAGHDVIGDIHLGDWGLQMGNTRRKRLLPYRNWRKSTRRQARSPRRTRRTRRTPWRLLLSCRVACAGIARSGIIS